jgi:acetolactate synthase regulatory subunit
MPAPRHHVTFNFRDQPELLDKLRLLARKRKTSLKAILAEALTAYLSQRRGEMTLLVAAEESFAEWENQDDRVYDTL